MPSGNRFRSRFLYRVRRSLPVRSILSNPAYIGKVRINGEVFPGQHEPIIEAKTWQQAADLFAAAPERRGRHPKGQHLFRGGMLRCGQCGDAMVPRTQGEQQVVLLRRALQDGQRVLRSENDPEGRDDEAVYSYFERVGLDVEATRQQLAEGRDRKLAEVRALREGAEDEAQRASERLSRVRRDYQDGKLAADDWAEQREQLTAECDGATAEAESLRKRESEVSNWGELRDVEGDVLNKLTDLRRAVAGEVRDAEGLDAVRAALTRLFEGFTVHHRPDRDPGDEPIGVEGVPVGEYLAWVREGTVPEDYSPAVAAQEYLIEVRPRPEVLEGYEGGELTPILHREPLQQAENNQRRSSVPS